MGEGEGEEPPLPLDDGEASSWSEEQEDDTAPAEGRPDEEHAHKEWDQAHEHDTAVLEEAPAAEDAEEGEYEEEYLHEDDYVPGDLVRIEDEPELFEGKKYWSLLKWRILIWNLQIREKNTEQRSMLNQPQMRSMNLQQVVRKTALHSMGIV